MTLANTLLLSDIDGTLSTYDFYLPVENLIAIDQYKAAGGLFSLSTGRSIRSTKRAMGEKIRPNCPAVIYNGGCIYDFSASKVLWMTFLPECARIHIDEVARKFPSLGCEIHVAEDLYCIRPSRRSRAHVLNERDEFTVYHKDQLPQHDWNKILFTGEPHEIDMLSTYLTPSDHRNDGYYFLRSEPGLFEILPLEANKGSGLRRLAGICGIPIENVYAIGDYYNDAELLKSAGVSATVADAPDDIKLLADYITCSCKEGAVADFIHYINKQHSVVL